MFLKILISTIRTNVRFLRMLLSNYINQPKFFPVFLIFSMMLPVIQAENADKLKQSMVRVSVTSQSYSFVRPWEKKRPESKRGIGVIIEKNLILVTAALVENATYLELEKLETGEKSPAKIIAVDYSANLGLIAPVREDFLCSNCKPIPITKKKSKIGDTFSVWQFEENGTPIVGNATLKSVHVESYPYNRGSLLVFEIKVLLSRAGGSYTLPVLCKGKLAGLMMRHNQGNETMTLVPSPIIIHFITDYNDGNYNGFPRAGFGVLNLEDPQTRRYLGADHHDSGVYVEKVQPGSAAFEAGLKVGDVLLAIGDYTIDKFGQYKDPDFGKLLLSHLVTACSYVGDFLNFRILRDKKEIDLKLKLKPFNSEEYAIPPFKVDKKPKYTIVSGLVFQELSREYLREWGANWFTSAPQEFVYFDINQWELIPLGQKFVFLSQVLPSEGNIGYHNLRFLRVTEINDMPINRIEEIDDAIAKNSTPYIKVEFESSPRVIYLDAKRLENENEKIQERYGISSLTQF